MNTRLIRKYAVPGPRYTSYPTVPYWDNGRPSDAQWEERFLDTFQHSGEHDGMSLYIHLPFCESLCTYCGCNTRITKNHGVEGPYIDALLKEWNLYLDRFPSKPRIAEVHLGGGTPTFFSPENLRRLLKELFAQAEVLPDAELSFEGHPSNTTEAHLQSLAELGFNRVSYGIQDFDPKVQTAIHRFQSVQEVEAVMAASRRQGYRSVNFDLVYGLPFQTLESMRETLETVIRLKPERIAFYSYAHVPWIKPGQRKFTEMDLPEPELKRAIYELGLALFEAAGYREVGMDHFALPNDTLFQAVQKGMLHRNFMGYTTTRAQLLVGLGVSAISDCWSAYVQNEKTLEAYLERVESGNWPFFRGHLLNAEDRLLRRHITNLMCRFETRWDETSVQLPCIADGLSRMDDFEAEGMVKRIGNTLQVLPEGRPFVRNVCMAFDARLWRNKPQTALFSSTV
jgi:oxygen-independent coproporphyrinogen-3 oxidase